MSSNEPPENNAQQAAEAPSSEIEHGRLSQDEKPGIPAQTAEVAGNVAPRGEHRDIHSGQGRVMTDYQALEPGNVTSLDSTHAGHMKPDLAAVPSPAKSASPVAKTLTDGTKSHHPVANAETAVASKSGDYQDKVHEFPLEDQSYAESYRLPQGTTLTQLSGAEVSVPFVALDAAQPMLLAPETGLMAETPFLEPALSIVESEAPRIQAFAKLEFDDGQFYMNTYSVELGRDIRAARLAFQRDLEANQQGDAKAKRRSSDGEDVSQTPSKLKREGSSRLAGSVVSETGGIMGVDMQDRDPRRRKKSKISKSTSSSSQYLSRKNSMNFPSAQTDYQSLAMASLSESTVGAHPVDPMSLLPSPDECPLIPIHPPAVAVGSVAGHKGISRKHVRIAFNFDKHLFEVEIKGKNGAFVDEQWYAPGEVRPLKSGSYIQIGGVGVRFVLPDVALGETGAETIGGSDPAQGGKMSFEFEDGVGQSIALADSSEDELSIDEDLASGEEEDEDDDDEEGEEEEEEEGLRQSAEGELAEDSSVGGQSESEGDRLAVEKEEELVEKEPSPEPPPPPPPPARRKGPGRPPKNGIISKREQALIARKAREDAKKLTQNQASHPPNSSKENGGISKTETGLQTTPPPKPEKRKYTKRKKVEPQAEGQGEQSQPTAGTSQADGHSTEPMAPPKPPKEKKPPKPPRSPSPVFDESQMTPEQLAKPQSSYVVLIHEALTNSKTGAMSLPQIYRAIERRYPFYKLRVTTTGWQSSVRHNLSQHHAFRKVERDGKGWMWGLVPGVSIEKEKKRRPSPPPPPPQHYLQQGPTVYPSLHYPGVPTAPGYGQPLMMPHQNGPYHPVPPGPGSIHQPFHPPAPPKNVHSLPPPLLTAQRDDSSYQSPYQPPPQSQAATLPQPQPPLQPQSQPQPQAQQSQPQYQHQHQHRSQPQPPPQTHINNHIQSQTHLPPTSSHSGANGFYANTRLSQAPPQQPNYHTRTTPPNQPRPPAPQQQTYTTAPAQRSASVGQDVLQAVGKFKNALISSMPDKVRGEVIVTSAINRTLGLQNSSTVLGKEDPQEKAIMKALAGMLGNLSKKNEAAAAAANTARQSASVSSQPPPQSQNMPLGPNRQPPQLQQQQPNRQQPPSPQPQPQPYPQSNRPPPQVQQGAQAQLLQLLQQIGNRNTVSPSAQQRPPQQSGSSVPAEQTQANGTGHPSTPPVTAASVPEKSQQPTLPNGVDVTAKEEPVGAATTLQDSAPSPDVVAGLKRPLEIREGSPDVELPEAKRVAAG